MVRSPGLPREAELRGNERFLDKLGMTGSDQVPGMTEKTGGRPARC